MLSPTHTLHTQSFFSIISSSHYHAFTHTYITYIGLSLSVEGPMIEGRPTLLPVTRFGSDDSASPQSQHTLLLFSWSAARQTQAMSLLGDEIGPIELTGLQEVLQQLFYLISN